MSFIELHFQALREALMLLTRIPIGSKRLDSNENSAIKNMSTFYYPCVGIVLALLLSGANALLSLSAFTPEVVAACLLCLWIGLTGAIHLDGLSDCTDAYFSGHCIVDDAARKEKILAVMHEPTCGPMAVAALILLLLLKWVALTQLLSFGTSLFLVPLLVVLVLPRALLLPYTASCNYVRKHGLASEVKPYLLNYKVWIVTSFYIVVTLWLLPFYSALLCLAGITLVAYWWRSLWCKTIGGFTGDCLGGLVELTEAVLLLGLIL